MTLAIVTDDGHILDVLEDIEEYDLSRPIAAAEVAEAIRETLDRAQRGELS